MDNYKQKALVCSGLKGEYSIELIDIPVPGRGEVLVELHAVGLNPMDWMMRDTGLFIPKWPAIFGFDGAGIVKQVGEGVTNVLVGDRVMHAGTFEEPRVSTFMQYVVMKADFVAKVPDNISLEEASTIPLVLATAVLGMYDEKRPPRGGIGLTPIWEGGRGKYAGEPIVINAGSTSVGQYMIQFAKLSGFSPIITTASKHNEEYLMSLGATHIVDRHTPLSDLPAAVRAITPTPIMYALDAISTAESQNAMFGLVAPGGSLLIDTHNRIDKAKLASGAKYVAQVYGDVQHPPERPCGLALYAHITGLLERGDVKPGRVEVIPGGLTAIPGALDRLKSGVSALKLVVCPHETV